MTTLVSFIFLMIILQSPFAYGDEQGPQKPLLDSRVQFFWQPYSKRTSFHLSTRVTQSMATTTNTDGTANSSSVRKTSELSPAISFGLNRNWALSVPIGVYTSLVQDVSPASGTDSRLVTSGFSDPSFTVENTTPFDFFRLHFGSGFSVSISHLNQTTATQEGNESVGGPTVTPYLGISFLPSFAWRYGGRLLYKYYGQRIETRQNGGNAVIDGGEEADFAAFVEFHGEDYYISPIVTYTSVGSQSTVVNNKPAVDSVATRSASATLNVGFNPTQAWQLTWSGVETFSPQYTTSAGLISEAHTTSAYAFNVRYEY